MDYDKAARLRAEEIGQTVRAAMANLHGRREDAELAEAFAEEVRRLAVDAQREQHEAEQKLLRRLTAMGAATAQFTIRGIARSLEYQVTADQPWQRAPLPTQEVVVWAPIALDRSYQNGFSFEPLDRNQLEPILTELELPTLIHEARLYMNIQDLRSIDPLASTRSRG